MKYLIIVLVAVVSQCASDDNQPVYPENCELPDCSIDANRYNWQAVFPHPDPNRYYQCAPYSMWEWQPMERWCTCGTVFNPRLKRCSYWWDEGWKPMCDWGMPPIVATCERHFDKWLNPPIFEHENEYEDYEEDE